MNPENDPGVPGGELLEASARDVCTRRASAECVVEIVSIIHWRQRICRAHLCLCWWQTKGADWPPRRCLSRYANGVQQSVHAGAGEGLQHRP
eukprot:COSAG02_NODE_17301_length_1013_cov_7.919037_1_plen_92_part_00